jgi:polysaccharide export outer membrane protein
MNSQGGDQILPVDWLAITQRADTETNFQLLPGDRVYVAEDRLVALDNGLAKIIAPVERVFGFTLLGTSVVQRLRFFNRYSGNYGY